MKTSLLRILAVVVVMVLCPNESRAQVIPVPNSDFSTGSGQIESRFLILATNQGATQIGNTGWYGSANATTIGLGIGFRPGIEINYDASSAGVAEIRYNLGASLGGLLNQEMPEANLWRPLVGQSLAANTSYRLSIDVTSVTLLDINALGDRGFGMGVTTGASAGSRGTFVANTQDSPSFASINLLTGDTYRLTLEFTTGSTVATGDMGVVIFAGRGIQPLQVSLLTDFDVDNVSLQIVPEPRAALLAIVGLSVLLGGRRFSRTLRNPEADQA